MAIIHPLTLKFMFCAQFCVHLFFHLYKIVMHPTSVQPTFYSQPQLFKEPFFKGLLNTDKYFTTGSQHPFWWSWLESTLIWLWKLWYSSFYAKCFSAFLRSICMQKEIATSGRSPSKNWPSIVVTTTHGGELCSTK